MPTNNPSLAADVDCFETSRRILLFTLQHSVFREPSSSLLPKGEGLNVPNVEVR